MRRDQQVESSPGLTGRFQPESDHHEQRQRQLARDQQQRCNLDLSVLFSHLQNDPASCMMGATDQGNPDRIGRILPDPMLGSPSLPRRVQLISRCLKSPWEPAFSGRSGSGRLTGCPKLHSSFSSEYPKTRTALKPPSCNGSGDRRASISMILQNSGDGVAPDLVSNVQEGAPDLRIAPRQILPGHRHDQGGDLRPDSWTSKFPPAAVVLPGDQLSVPAQQGVGRDERADLPSHAPANELRPRRTGWNGWMNMVPESVRNWERSSPGNPFSLNAPGASSEFWDTAGRQPRSDPAFLLSLTEGVFSRQGARTGGRVTGGTFELRLS